MNDVTSPNKARVERENIALCRQEGRPLPVADHYLIQVLDPNGLGTLVEIDDPVPKFWVQQAKPPLKTTCCYCLTIRVSSKR